MVLTHAGICYQTCRDHYYYHLVLPGFRVLTNAKTVTAMLLRFLQDVEQDVEQQLSVFGAESIVVTEFAAVWIAKPSCNRPQDTMRISPLPIVARSPENLCARPERGLGASGPSVADR
jgi:hypothetical protein